MHCFVGQKLLLGELAHLNYRLKSATTFTTRNTFGSVTVGLIELQNRYAKKKIYRKRQISTKKEEKKEEKRRHQRRFAWLSFFLFEYAKVSRAWVVTHHGVMVDVNHVFHLLSRELFVTIGCRRNLNMFGSSHWINALAGVGFYGVGSFASLSLSRNASRLSMRSYTMN